MKWKCSLCNHCVEVSLTQAVQIKKHEEFHNPNIHSFKDGHKRNVTLGKVEWGLIGE